MIFFLLKLLLENTVSGVSAALYWSAIGDT